MIENILGMEKKEWDRLTKLHKIKIKKEKPITKAEILRQIKIKKQWIELAELGGHWLNLSSIPEIEQEIKKLYFKLRMMNAPKEEIGTLGVSPYHIQNARQQSIRNFINVNSAKKAECLFHSDRNNSMHIYGDKYYCFSCNAHGSVIDIVMKLYSMTFIQAVKKLNNI